MLRLETGERDGLMSYYAKLPFDELIALVTEHPEDVELRLAVVEYFVRFEKYEEALLEALRAEELAPDDPDAKLWKAMCLIYTGEMEQGYLLLQRMIRNNPCSDFQRRLVTEVVPLFVGESITSEYVEGFFAGWFAGLPGDGQGKVTDAFTKCNSSFLEAVNHVSQNTQQGIQDLEKHMELFPDDVNAKLYLAIAYCDIDRTEDAAQRYREVIEQDNECATAYFDLAAIVTQPDEAVELTRRGLRCCPFATHARYNLGVFLIQQGQQRDARRELSRIPADSPIYVEGLIATALSWEEGGDLEGAVAALEKAVLRQPERADARAKLGKLLSDCGRTKEALAVFDQTIQTHPDIFSVWANKGLLHLKAGEYQPALDALQKSLELNPQCEDVAINLAVLLAEIGSLEKAIEILEEAIHFHPENAAICQNLGAFYCHTEELDQALFYTDRAIELGIDSPAIFWNMASIYCIKDMRELCLEYLARAIERDRNYSDRFLKNEDFRKYQSDPEFIALTDEMD
ncbi:MAG: tetratricopeptide repeat protein [Planctomycetaceae bacterium]|nr:tetratricopeptide repeat protein [Planctomycetaceae bacterium]MCP4464177.1 tetratricopeptide repeat protein [Planctomycetaceae bacterium]